MSIFHSQPLSGIIWPTSGGAQRATTATTLSSSSWPLRHFTSSSEGLAVSTLESHPSPDPSSGWKDVLLSASADNRWSWQTNWLGSHLWVSWQPAFPLSPRQCHSNLKPNHSTHVPSYFLLRGQLKLAIAKKTLSWSKVMQEHSTNPPPQQCLAQHDAKDSKSTSWLTVLLLCKKAF